MIAALLTGIPVGSGSALRASEAEAGTALHDGGSISASPSRQRMRSLLVVGQVAGSLVLLIGAGLFVKPAERPAHGSDLIRSHPECDAESTLGRV
jgi:hypothetical protein